MMLLTDGFNQLSVKEREFALDTLHGVVQPIDESPEGFIDNALQNLDVAIAKIKRQRMAYDMAIFLNPGYVQNRDFRINFLRGARYDVTLTATRLIKHFELKLELFGLDCLVRDITFDDLDDDAAEMYLRAGYFYPKSYDKLGRRLMLYSTERTEYRNPASYVSSFFFQLQTIRYSPIDKLLLLFLFFSKQSNKHGVSSPFFFRHTDFLYIFFSDESRLL